MENNLMKVDPTQYGLEPGKAKEIESVFLPMIEKMKELEVEYDAVKGLEINGETCKRAKELRLKYVKVRTGTAKIHKEVKAYFLAGSKFVDGWKNTQLYASQGIEEHLKGIETHYERIEAERKQKLNEERQAELSKYTDMPTQMNLAEMPDDAWGIFLGGAKRAHEDKLEAERKAEQERIERERKEAAERERQRIEQERIRKENERLKREADERERQRKLEIEEQRKKEQAERERIEAEHRKKLEAERKERERIEAENERKRQEEQKKLEAERKERERIELEARRKQDEERQKLELERRKRVELEAQLKAKQETEKAEQARLQKQKQLTDMDLATDKNKLGYFAGMVAKNVNYELRLQSQEAKELYADVNQKLIDLVSYMGEKVKEMK